MEEKQNMGGQQSWKGVIGCIALTVNFIVGAGMFSIPIAFAKAGILFSITFIIVLSLLMYYALLWVVEAYARIVELNNGIYKGTLTKLYNNNHNHSIDNEDDDEEQQMLESLIENEHLNHHHHHHHNSNSNSNNNDISSMSIKPKFEIHEITMSVADIVEKCYGASMAKFYAFSCFSYVFIAMWYYTILFCLSVTSIFAIPGLKYIVENENEHEADLLVLDTTYCPAQDGLSNLTPECRFVYTTFGLLFGIYVFIIIAFDFNDQTKLQMTLTSYGMMCSLLMCLTVFLSYLDHPYNENNIAVLESSSSSAAAAAAAAASFKDNLGDAEWFFDKDNFILAFNTFVFSQMCHHGVPPLLSILQDKRRATWAFGGAITFTSTIYLLLGIFCASYFGTNASALVSLNWQSYTAGANKAGPIAKVISVLVRFFPVLTVSAAYPLNCITLGDTLYNQLCRSKNKKKQKILTNYDRNLQLLCRYITALPALVGGMLTSNIGFLVNVMGVISFILAIVMPAAIQLKTKYMCIEAYKMKRKMLSSSSNNNNNNNSKNININNDDEKEEEEEKIPAHAYQTYWNTWLTNDFMMIFMIMFGVLCICYTVYTLILEYAF